MIFLLDTDTLIYMVRGLKATGRQQGRRQRALDLVGRCRQAQKEGHAVGVSAITVSELEFGARKGGRYEDEIAAVTKILAPFDIYDYAAVPCGRHYGHVRHELERAGQAIGAMDLLIAAHALSLDATLVTNNLAHFRRVPGLKATDWR
ncbi:MAG TPA: type II toxin-antitoxin system VapC family toxin [Gemmataceae bacterium]|nr:type II toxin-antitoxin system VapC family toxin [Gemmataceae bacterium]